MSRATAYVIGQFILFGILAVALLVLPPGQTPLLRLIGLALMAAAFVVLGLAVLEFYSRNTTLPNVTPTPKQRAGLVETGIYRYVRHPIYTSVLSGALGAALAHGHVIPLLIALVLIVFFTAKSRYEESLLRAAYPTYAAYMTRTGRFLPFL